MIKALFSSKSFLIYFFISLVAIEFLATTTTVHIELVESMWDKSNHFIAFFVLYILLSLGYQNLTLVFKVVLLFVFGLQIEIVQELSGRSPFSTLDMLADSIGILVGILTIYFFKQTKFYKSFFISSI